MLDFHLAREFAQDQVHCAWTTTSFTTSDDVRRLIDLTWQQTLDANPRVNLFDGEMCRLESYRVTERLELKISRTSYKSFLGTNMSHPDIADRDGPGALANPIGLSCALISSDERLLLGKRNDRVAYYPSRIHPFAGAMEPVDPPDVFAELRRELHEELAMHQNELLETRCMGLIQDRKLRQPELVFWVRSSLPADEIAGRMDAKEHLGTVQVQCNERDAEHVLSDAMLTPVAVGTVLLWGKRMFGAEWFERRRKALR